LLMQYWKLARRVSDLGPRPAQTPWLLEIQAMLSASCNDFGQQLFEEDCLLLPRITHWRVHCTQQKGRRSCPR
jgi:hypothetical protein